MAKTTNPFMSLGGQGTVADTLTVQRHRRGHVMRKKPTPTQRFTLPIAYHRYLYSDYCDYWNTLTLAQKEAYRPYATIRKLTPFAYFMSYHLTNLPDIALWYHLDRPAAATALDSSRNENTGTYIGPTPAHDFIHWCRYFDGINDRIQATDSPSLRVIGDATWEFLIRPDDFTTWSYLLSKFWNAEFSMAMEVSGKIAFQHGDGAAETKRDFFPAGTLVQGEKTHIVITRNITTMKLHGFKNGVDSVGGQAFAKTPITSAENLYIGRRPAGVAFTGLMDEIRIYNRVLPDVTIRKHAERRYPL